jgi:ribosomal protein S18 acetylase RimI-like enzyme
MSAGVSGSAPRIRARPLAEATPRELRPLLDEEVELWGRELSWDFSEVSAAVASGLDRGSLAGQLIEAGDRPVAYCYYMVDGGRAVVGSLFASEAVRGRGLEEALLDAVIGEAQAQSATERVECQTLFSTAGSADQRFRLAGFTSRPRHYLMRSLQEPPRPEASSWRLRPVKREDLDGVARIIHRSHVGSLDAALNLTYGTPAHCRTFVETLVLRSGCGRFDAESSFVAERDGQPVGVLLASRLSRTNGHICQVSVEPAEQARGLGALLVTSCLEALARQGLRTASLSVTVGNRRAYALYQRLGFRLHREFAAHAWVRPPARIEIPA